MISKKDILKMVHDVTHRTGGGTARKQFNSRREWFVGLVLFIVLTAAGGFVNIQAHSQFNSLESNIEGEMTPVKKYNESAAATAKEIYTKRLETFNTLASDIPFVPVPVVDEENETEATDQEDETKVEDEGEEEENDDFDNGGPTSE